MKFLSVYVCVLFFGLILSDVRDIGKDTNTVWVGGYFKCTRGYIHWRGPQIYEGVYIWYLMEDSEGRLVPCVNI